MRNYNITENQKRTKNVMNATLYLQVYTVRVKIFNMNGQIHYTFC